MSRPAILFVCLGNICRSPLAEAALRAEAGRAGLDIEIDSAGTGAWHAGNPPDVRARAVARKNGVEIDDLRARQVVESDFTRFTHIYALDGENLANLRRMAPPGSTAEVGMLLDLVPGREGEPVVDPYFGRAEGFETTWQDVQAAARNLVAKLAGQAAPS